MITGLGEKLVKLGAGASTLGNILDAVLVAKHGLGAWRGDESIGSAAGSGLGWVGGMGLYRLASRRPKGWGSIGLHSLALAAPEAGAIIGNRIYPARRKVARDGN